MTQGDDDLAALLGLVDLLALTVAMAQAERDDVYVSLGRMVLRLAEAHAAIWGLVCMATMTQWIRDIADRGFIRAERERDAALKSAAAWEVSAQDRADENRTLRAMLVRVTNCLETATDLIADDHGLDAEEDLADAVDLIAESRKLAPESA